MTMPEQSDRAVHQAREFLVRLASPYGAAGIKGIRREIRAEALHDYIPASKAELRFRAIHVEGVIRPVTGKHEDLLISLAVVPIKCVFPAHGQYCPLLRHCS